MVSSLDPLNEQIGLHGKGNFADIIKMIDCKMGEIIMDNGAQVSPV